MYRWIRLQWILLLWAASALPVLAAEVQVAVAANFSAPMKQLAAVFTRDTGHTVVVAYGSTGKLYAQIRNGAPFEVLLSADGATPARLVADGAALAASRFTYARGRLVLWSAQAGIVDDRGEVLRRGDFVHLALANPALAPYGAAAVATMRSLGVYETVRPRLVNAENIGQAHQFVQSGNAALGFLALSQVMQDGRILSGSAWLVPEHLYPPIDQDAVLLTRGQGNPAAQAFLDYLKRDAVRTIIRSFGYAP